MSDLNPPMDDPVPDRETMLRGQGSTASERYLQDLCEKAFLKFWSHPCLFTNDGATNTGVGKELCDLLVIFGNDVLIFSDKHCEFPQTSDLTVAWSRWFKRAVQAGAHQVFGAERWIKSFPERIFLDRECKRRFPLKLPAPDVARFHRIVVAHGASRRCRDHFGGSGSLMLDTSVRGEDHKSEAAIFTIGQVNPDKGFVHVFDDTSLDLVLSTLDTVPDFVAYLLKKEAFFNQRLVVSAAGEEELLAHYLQRLNAAGDHDFLFDETKNAIGLMEGFWKEFCSHPQRLAQIEANRVSYVWDALIEKFSHHIMTGTQEFTNAEKLNESEVTLRFLASENRTRRRALSASLLEVAQSARPGQKYARLQLGQSPTEPTYVFLVLSKESMKGEDEYRKVRRSLLEKYCLVTKYRNRGVQDIIGIAVPPVCEVRDDGVSEDLMYLDGRVWTPADDEHAALIATKFSIWQSPSQKIMRYTEYPDLTPPAHWRLTPRNALCPCGSNRKFKKCCWRKL